MYKSKPFIMSVKSSWQYAYKLMFSKPKGQVNVQYDITVEHPHWGVPQESRLPKDWDIIVPGYSLAINNRGHLNIDDGNKDSPNIVTVIEGEDSRNLMDCFLIALRFYYYDNDKTHHPNVHTSWYNYILDNE